ncbi:hypothetical protein ACOMHN_061582 [Nucella lapillus]
MAATMLTRLALQTVRLTVSTLRQQTLSALPHRSFSVSSCSFGKKYFTEKHEWIDFEKEKGVGTIGITDHAQEMLGEIVYVEISSEPATKVEEGESVGVVESVKAASDIYCPVGGEILSVNDKLKDEPQLVNKSPMDDGWLFKLRVDNPEEVEGLMTEEAYTSFLKEQEL